MAEVSLPVILLTKQWWTIRRGYASGHLQSCLSTPHCGGDIRLCKGFVWWECGSRHSSHSNSIAITLKTHFNNSGSVVQMLFIYYIDTIDNMKLDGGSVTCTDHLCCWRFEITFDLDLALTKNASQNFSHLAQHTCMCIQHVCREPGLNFVHLGYRPSLKPQHYSG